MAKRSTRKRRRREQERRRLVIACIAVVALVFGSAFLAFLLLSGNRDSRASSGGASTGTGLEAEENMSTEQTPFTTYDGVQDVEEEEAPAAKDATEEDTEKEVPPALPVIADEASVKEKLQSMTLREKVAQMFIITPEQLTGYQQVTQCGETTYAALDRYPVGGLIYFSSNMESKEQTRQMLRAVQDYATRQTGIPLFLAVDEEGGRVARVADKLSGIPKTPTMAELAREGEQSVYEASLVIGNYLSDLGFNLDFAPDADVLTNSGNTAIGDRSFGEDAETVAKMADAYIRGLAQNNVWGTYKHFPGHGGTAEDTHDGYAYTDKSIEELKETELAPFLDGIKKKVPMIMAAHVSLPQVTGGDLPATLSKEIITDLLRKDMGYDGVVVTDALNMGAVAQHYSAAQSAVMALEAGCDILLMPSDFTEAYDAVVQAVEDGTLSKERIDESVKRILMLKQMSHQLPS